MLPPFRAVVKFCSTNRLFTKFLFRGIPPLFSVWSIRVTAYVKRFVNNLRNKLAKNEIKVGRLSINEIERAEMEWVKCAQKGLQDNSDCKKYKDQLGILNENDILACKRKLEFSELEMSTKDPLYCQKMTGLLTL